MNAAVRLQRLRAAMQRHKIQAYLVPSEDAHASEYIAECDQRRAFLSGFTGSAGWAVVTETQALLWTDGRYFTQAEQQLDGAHWTLMRMMEGVPTQQEWLCARLAPPALIGVDPALMSFAKYDEYASACRKVGHELVPVADNLVDEVWASERPVKPSGSIVLHTLEYAGRTTLDKLADVRQCMKENDSELLVLSGLDEVAWLTNLRGSDVHCTPVFFAHAIVTPTSAILHVDEERLTPEARDSLCGVFTVAPYSSAAQSVTALATNASTTNAMRTNNVWLSPQCSAAIRCALPPSHTLLASPTRDISPVCHLKSIKNATELSGFRACHLHDAAALCAYLHWLQGALAAHETVTECSGADKLAGFRAQQPDFVSLSFDTISGAGPNGAIIHYKPEPESCAPIRADQLYLVDSGGQYLSGTTDITRTVHFGEPTDYERECFTLVLKGHIALAQMRFPKGRVTGQHLDAFARSALWQTGRDYAHGTGHGVGHFSGVHEGPQRISHRLGGPQVVLKEGMIVSNEPGYYEVGNFGIRIENLVEIISSPSHENFLEFNTISLVPIQRTMIDRALLTASECAWLNAYHAQCLSAVAPILEQQNRPQVLDWLQSQTQPI